jgi:hypothetical protein
MTQEEHLICEIEEYHQELQRGHERIRSLEKLLKEKEIELYYAKLKSPDGALFRRLDIDGYMTDNCNRICEIVKSWLPPKDVKNTECEYSDGWNDYRDECLANLK